MEQQKSYQEYVPASAEVPPGTLRVEKCFYFMDSESLGNKNSERQLFS